MYIQNIKIKNYRNFADFEMTFKDGLNVIIGSNNSGKTNLLRAIELMADPDSITIHDFNKNTILNNFEELYKKQAPEIEIEYQIYHEIYEGNTNDESIMKLLSFLGMDKIEEQKGTQEHPTQYNIIANINMKYAINPKKLDNYIKQVAEADTFQKYIDTLKLSLKYYAWDVTNGANSLPAEKKDVRDIFKIDFIEAERDTSAVYKETRKTINEFIKEEHNALSMQQMKQTISEEMKTKILPVLTKISTIVEQEKNEIGLAKGNVAIAQDIRIDPSISDYYIIDVKDTKSGYIIPLSHNGVGYNNLINLYMLIKLVEIRQGKDFRILCLEEPEAHLHPAMQYKLFAYLRKIDDEDKLKQQIFVTTHSSNITAVAGLDNIFMLDYQRDNNVVDGISRSLKEQFTDHNNPKDTEKAKKHLMKFLDVTRSDMLFASKVILVEGIAEKLLLPKFMENLGCSYEDEHISIVEIGGKHFNHFLRVYANNPIDKKVLCITDKDYPSIDDGLQPISEYLEFEPEHVKKLNITYKKNDNIEIRYQTKYGRTFEDEMFLTNYDKNNCITGCKLLKIALCETLHPFINTNRLSFTDWNSNKERIDAKSRKKIQKILKLFEDAISKYSVEKEKYENLFFANLFLSYAKDKKGDVALQILADEHLIKSIVAPEYIKEGLEWLLK